MADLEVTPSSSAAKNGGRGRGGKRCWDGGYWGLEGLILGIMKWCGCPSSGDADGVIDSRIAG